MRSGLRTLAPWLFPLLLMTQPGAVAAMAAPPREATVIYTGATVLDVRSGEARRGLAIVVRGERIEALVPAETVRASPLPDAEVVDVSGLHAVPGLIDTHTHSALWNDRPSAEALLRRELLGGVTAVRDLGGDARLLAWLSRAARTGELDAPDLHFSALVAGPDFFEDGRLRDSARGVTPGAVPWQQALTPESDVRLVVALARGTGATGLKLYANLPARQVRRVAAEAHRQGLAVWAHGAVFPAGPRQLVSAGADTLSHVCMLAYEVSEPMPRGYHRRAPVDEAKLAGPEVHPKLATLFAEMKRRGVILDATLWLYEHIERMRARMKQEPRPPTYCSAELAGRLTAQAHRAGVAISTGTDVPAPEDSPHPSLLAELEVLQRRAGMTPLEVLRSATLVGARVLGQEREMGAIEPGKLANLVFLSRDPLEDVAALRSVVLTVKRGARHARRGDAQPLPPEDMAGGDGP